MQVLVRNAPFPMLPWMLHPIPVGRSPFGAASCAVLLLAACGSFEAAPTPPAFDSARAWGHLEAMVEFGPRPSGSPALARAREYIVRELRSYGLEPSVQEFTNDTPIGAIAFANVHADIGPADAPLVALVAHIDTKRFDWPFLGANDSASGTAVLLELARCLASDERRRAVAYRVLFVDGEESIDEEWVDPDNRYGSRYHVAELVRTGEIERVAAAVVIDLVGDRDLKLSHETLSDPELLQIFFRAAHAAGLGRHVDGDRREIKDDHLSFMAANVPSVDLIDFEYGPSNAYWHDPRDNLSHVSEESLGAAGSIVLAGLPGLEAWIR